MDARDKYGHDGSNFEAADAMRFRPIAEINMLIETPGGFDYTGADCQG